MAVSEKEKNGASENVISVNITDDDKVEKTDNNDVEDIQSGKSDRKVNMFTRLWSFIKKYLSDGVIDRPMLIIILLILAFGSIMVFSASYAYAYSRYNDSSYFIKKQIMWVIVGVTIMLTASKIKYKVYKFWSIALFALAFALLGVVLVFGKAAGVAQRWIIIGGFSFQPSELMKLAIVLLLAWYAERFSKSINDKSGKKRFLYGLFIPAMIIGAVCGLMLLENHLSGTIIIFLIGAICLWALGTDKKWFIIIGIAGGVTVALVLLIVWFKDAPWNKIDDLLPSYVVKRIDMWLRPDNYKVLDDTWQTVQGKIAVGSGGFFGTGFGKSFQKHLYVSQPQNDFIFAIICEELGFIGAVGLILLYIAFIYRGLVIARHAPDVFSAVAAVGIVGHVGIQALLNMMVVTAILPNTGISLPLISYGGSSLVMLLAEMGVLLSISRKSKIQK